MKEKKKVNGLDALSKLVGNDEVFNQSATVPTTTVFEEGMGRNSGLEYKNKYAIYSANKKLASADVVDIGTFKQNKQRFKDEEKKEDLTETKSEIPSTDDTDDDFDKFFDDFMSKLESDDKQDESRDDATEAEEKIDELTESIAVKPEVPIKKPRAQRKKKRSIDIDIISGGVGGDII